MKKKIVLRIGFIFKVQRGTEHHYKNQGVYVPINYMICMVFLMPYDLKSILSFHHCYLICGYIFLHKMNPKSLT